MCGGFKCRQYKFKREYGFCSSTVLDQASFCRKVAVDVVITQKETIGGPGCVVEKDESKFGKNM